MVDQAKIAESATTSGDGVSVERSRFVEWLDTHSRLVVVGLVVVTLLLIAPMVALIPDTPASQDPPGEVFDNQDLINDRFTQPFYTPFYVLEARDGNLLRRDPLLELYENEVALRSSDVSGDLVSFYSSDFQTEVDGVYTIADAVDVELRAAGVADGLAGATDDQVRLAAAAVLAEGSPQREELIGDIAPNEAQGEITIDGETVPDYRPQAVGVVVFADNDKLGGGSFTVNVGTDQSEKEDFGRAALAELRGDQEYFEAFGIGIDLNLTQEEQGAEAAPFVMAAIIAVLLIVGIVLRTYWAVALTGAALALLIVWLKGLTNLLGFQTSVILDFIVPIAMISFGADFVIHAVHRYREEFVGGHRPHTAFVLGISGVLGALTLAFVSDAVAFLANVTSGIPAIIQFGVGAALAIGIAYVVLGLVTPLALSRIEARLGTSYGRQDESRARRAGRLGLFLVVSVASGVVVLLTITFPLVGAVALVLYVAFAIGAPYLIGRRRAPQVDISERDAATPAPVGAESSRWARVGRAVMRLTRVRWILLPAVFVFTVVCGFLAAQLETSFEAKDFLSSDSDFVKGLDVLSRHFGQQGGESMAVYIEADFTDTDSLLAVDRASQTLDESAQTLARNADGDASDRTVTDLVRETMAVPEAVAIVSASTGVDLTDTDADGLPDSPEQIRSIYEFGLENGIPLDERRLLFTPDDFTFTIWLDDDGQARASQMRLSIPDSQQQSSVTAAREEIEPVVETLEAELAGDETFAGLAGSPITREQSLNATQRALQISIPVAVLACFVVAWIFMRSFSYALVTIIPIILVSAWLYAFMYVAGFDLNFVTATIGAISIGVGIDYAIHFTMRYRQELATQSDTDAALAHAGAETGGALAASAVSSIVGFLIMAFAPMPLFATYGLLTAVMITFALAAALLVLPSLLRVVSK